MQADVFSNDRHLLPVHIRRRFENNQVRFNGHHLLQLCQFDTPLCGVEGQVFGLVVYSRMKYLPPTFKYEVFVYLFNCDYSTKNSVTLFTHSIKTIHGE